MNYILKLKSYVKWKDFNIKKKSPNSSWIQLLNLQILSVMYRYEGLRRAHRWDLYLYVKVYTFDSFYWQYLNLSFYFWNKKIDIKFWISRNPLEGNDEWMRIDKKLYRWNPVQSTKWSNWQLIRTNISKIRNWMRDYYRFFY